MLDPFAGGSHQSMAAEGGEKEPTSKDQKSNVAMNAWLPQASTVFQRTAKDIPAAVVD
jgi:hypothetical protein